MFHRNARSGANAITNNHQPPTTIHHSSAQGSNPFHRTLPVLRSVSPRCFYYSLEANSAGEETNGNRRPTTGARYSDDNNDGGQRQPHPPAVCCYRKASIAAAFPRASMHLFTRVTLCPLALVHTSLHATPPRRRCRFSTLRTRRGSSAEPRVVRWRRPAKRWPASMTTVTMDAIDGCPRGRNLRGRVVAPCLGRMKG